MPDDSKPEVTPTPNDPTPEPKPAESKVKPAEAKAPEQPEPPPKAPEGLHITPEQMERFRQAERERDALRAAEDARAEEQRKADEQRLIEEGKLKEVIAKKDEELARQVGKLRENETIFKTTVRDRELAVELAKHTLVEFAAPQLMKLWRDELETVKDGDVFKVQTRDGKPVEKFVADNLKSKEYANFLPPGSRGGAGTKNADVRPAHEMNPPDPNDRMAAQLKASYTNRHLNVPVALAGRNRLAGGNVPNN